MNLLELLYQLIIIVLAAGILLAFPIYAAIILNRRGQRGWMIATILTTFIGYGWLIGLIGLARPARKQVALADKCQFCGGLSGTVEIRNVDKSTGKSISSIYGVIAWGLFGLIFIGFGIAMAILIWSEGNSGVIRWNAGPFLAGIAYLSFGVGIGRWGVAAVAEYLKADRIQIPIYRCNNCKKEWNQYTTGSQASAPAQPFADLPAAPPAMLHLAEPQAEATAFREVCWFCQKSQPADGKPHQVVMQKKQDGQRLEQTIAVPRCSSCQAYHMKKQPFLTVVGTILTLLCMGSCVLIGTMTAEKLGFWSWVIGTAVSFVILIGAVVIQANINQRQAKAAGTRAVSVANSTHPQVLDLIKQGWQLDTTKSGTAT